MHNAHRTILLRDLDRFTVEDVQARVALRDARDGHGIGLYRDRELIEAIAGLFEDVPAGSRFARVKRVRPDRLHATVFLLRSVTDTPPRELVKQLGMPPRYLRFALQRGRRLVEQARDDGRLDMALWYHRHRRGRDDPGPATTIDKGG